MPNEANLDRSPVCIFNVGIVKTLFKLQDTIPFGFQINAGSEDWNWKQSCGTLSKITNWGISIKTDWAIVKKCLNFNILYLPRSWVDLWFKGWKWNQKGVVFSGIHNQGIWINADWSMMTNNFQLQYPISFVFSNGSEIWRLQMKAKVCSFLCNWKLWHLRPNWSSFGQKCKCPQYWLLGV